MIWHQINLSRHNLSSRTPSFQSSLPGSSNSIHDYSYHHLPPFTMELLKYFFKPHLDLPHRAVSPRPECIDRLTSLPSELLLLIYDVLWPEDAVCLCLCNHRLHALLKAHYEFSTPRSINLSICHRLERDLPEYFACDVCSILHRYDGSESFGLSGLARNRSSQLPCIRKGYNSQTECFGGSSINMRSHAYFPYSGNRITFLQIKLAMRRYCYGARFGINTDSLAFTQVREYVHPWAKNDLSSPIYRNIKVLFSMDAQVCPEPLGVLIRMQDIILYDVWEDSKIPGKSNPHLLWLYEICQHTSLVSKADEIDSVYKGWTSSFTYTCYRCNTVSLIEFRRINARLALVLTRWVDLGRGIDREDPRWKIHIVNCKDKTIPYELPHAFTLQSPRKCFENTASLSLKDFRSRNISYLRGDRYREGEPFAAGRGQSLWHISYKEPQKKWTISSLFF